MLYREKRDTATVAFTTQSNPIAANLPPVVRKVSGLIELSHSFLSPVVGIGEKDHSGHTERCVQQ